MGCGAGGWGIHSPVWRATQANDPVTDLSHVMSSPEIFLLATRTTCVNGNWSDLPCVVDGVRIDTSPSPERENCFPQYLKVAHLGATDSELVQETLNDFFYPQASSSIRDHLRECTLAHRHHRRFLEGRKAWEKLRCFHAFLLRISIQSQPEPASWIGEPVYRYPYKRDNSVFQSPECLLAAAAWGAHGPTAVPENRLMLHRLSAGQVHELRASSR